MENKEDLISVDKIRVQSQFNSAANSYDAFDFLQREVSDRLLSRLEDVVLSPDFIVDLGSGTGRNGDLLRAIFKKSSIINLDIAEEMLGIAKRKKLKIFQNQKFVCGDIESIPLRPKSMDLAFSNLALQWCPDLPRAFSSVNTILKPGSLFIFSTLGPDTLQELRKVFSSHSDLPHVSTFLDMHDIGDTLSSVGFADPVMESEMITVNYDEPIKLLRDLKGIGASNADIGRRKSLTGPSRMRRILNEYDKFRENGKIPATYEVILGHAWAVNVSRTNEQPIRRLK